MTAEQLFRQKIGEKGMTVADMARSINADPEGLRRSLAGKRQMKPREFIPLCMQLGIGLQDITKTDGWEVDGAGAKA